MFAALYDKNLKALGPSVTTYATSKWSLVRKAYEFDELSVTTKRMDNSGRAMYIGLHNDDGSLKYLASSGKPTTKDNMTTYVGTDIRQIFKQNVAIDLTDVALEDQEEPFKSQLMQLYEYLLGIPLSFPNNGFNDSDVDVEIDTSDLATHQPTWHEEYLKREASIGDLWDVIQAVNMLYDCYVVTEVDITEKKVKFVVKRIYEEISFKLSDFNESKVINNTSVTNRIQIRQASSKEDKIGSYGITLYLLSNDLVCTQYDLNNIIPGTTKQYKDFLIYPPRLETILSPDDDDVEKMSENYDNAVAEGYEKLYSNRFQGKVEINTDCAMGYLLKRLDLNTFAKIYGYNSADDISYRKLPVMQISEESSGKIRVSFGRLDNFWY